MSTWAPEQWQARRGYMTLWSLHCSEYDKEEIERVREQPTGLLYPQTHATSPGVFHDITHSSSMQILYTCTFETSRLGYRPIIIMMYSQIARQQIWKQLYYSNKILPWPPNFEGAGDNIRSRLSLMGSATLPPPESILCRMSQIARDL